MNKRFILVDGSSLLYRAFYALPLLTAANGEYTNAVYGFATMLQKLMEEHKTEYLVVAFDKGKHTFRNEIFPDIRERAKRHRQNFPDRFPFFMSFLLPWEYLWLKNKGMKRMIFWAHSL